MLDRRSLYQHCLTHPCRSCTATRAESQVGCATLAPADDAEERRTILLVGKFASDSDPPVGAEIVGTLLTDDGGDAKGSPVETVVPPPLVRLLYWRSTTLSPSSTGGTDECPADTDHSSKPRTGASQVPRSRPRRITPSGDHGGVCKRRSSRCDPACGRIRQRQPRGVLHERAGEPVAITAASGLYEDPNGDPNVLHYQAVIEADDLTP